MDHCACHHAPVPRVVTLAEPVLHLRLPHELQHCGRRDRSGNRARGQIAGGGGGRVKLTVDGELDGLLLLDGSRGVDLHVRRLLLPGLRHGGCGGCLPVAVARACGLRRSDAFV